MEVSGKRAVMDLYYQDQSVTLYQGNALDVLRELPERSAHCCVTSPPYFGLRNYGIPQSLWPDGWTGCHGLEPTIEMYVAHEVAIFRELRSVLHDEGTLWLNLGDTYACSNYTCHTRPTGPKGQPSFRSDRRPREDDPHKAFVGLKEKDLIGIPWRVALALQADGWYLRCDIIWHKPNAMPESVRDRPTKSHEYIFLLSKSEKYYYDFDAIKEPVTGGAHDRGDGVNPKAKTPGKNSRIHQDRDPAHKEARHQKQNESFSAAVCGLVEIRNKRSVWTVPTFPNPEAHFATFPPDLIKPCILAGCPKGAVTIDPFCGSGTTLKVSKYLNRKSIGIDLKTEYLEMTKNSVIQEVLDL